MSTVLNYNQSLKALNVSRPILFSVEDETTDHFARTMKVISFVCIQRIVSMITVKPFNLAALKVGDYACKIILAPSILAN